MPAEIIVSVARVREVWMDSSLSLEKAAAALGMSIPTLWRRAAALGFPPARSGFFRIERDRFLDLWQNDRLTNRDIAAEIGCSPRSVGHLAKQHGAPPRRIGPRVLWDEALFARMYLAGLSLRDLRRHFGRHPSTLCHAAQRLGLPPRRPGVRSLVTLDQWYEAELGRRMAVSAAETRAAMEEAGLVPVRGRPKGAAPLMLPAPAREAA